jgi:hypothetical protein
MVWKESVRCLHIYLRDEFKYSSHSEYRLEQYRGEWGLHPTWILNWICDHALVRPTQRLIVVGASAGGVKALCALVKALPAPSPVPMYIVLHTGPDSLMKSLPHVTVIAFDLSKTGNESKKASTSLGPGGTSW